MAQSDDPAQWLLQMFESGKSMMEQFAKASAGAASAGVPPHPAAHYTEQWQKFADMQQDYARQVSESWLRMLGTPSAQPKADDRRFAGDAWRSHPLFEQLTRLYLDYSEYLQEAVEKAPVDDRTRGQLGFAVRQYIDAMSPSNFLATNPEAMQLAMETGGTSLIEGMSLYFKDLAQGRVSMTDETAFEVGRNIATTEGSVVYENELIQLVQYAPRTTEVYERPLVMLPPCINKFYILDLQPENSFVRYAVEQGHTVFMVSWRNITPALGHFTWDDYLKMGVMQAIDVARDVSGSDQVNALGFCIGGALLACALAVQAAETGDPAASVTLLTSMLDYGDTGEIGLLVTDESVGARELAIGRGGVMHGKELGFTFSALRANDLVWQYVVNSYLKGKAPPAFDLLHWNVDATNLPGPMFCWYVRNLYLENNLREPGKTVQCGVPVDLADIAAPAFVYASRDDHIVPWRTAYESTQLLGGEATFVLGASGHIAGVVNPPLKKKRNYWADGALDPDPERWLQTATSVPGSWWPKWAAWLAPHGGARVAAPSRAGNGSYRPIEPAPGRYVKAKAD